jgi:GDP-mannose transporter
MIILNKLVINTYNLNYPMVLLFLQKICALVLIVACKALGVLHYPAFDIKVARRWMPLTLLFVAMLWTSMKSLGLMSVAVQTILKNLAIILTAFGDSYFFGKKLTSFMFVSFAMMVLGSYIGSVDDKQVTFWGLFWTFANVLVTVAYVLYMKLLLGNESKEIGRYGPVFYNSLLSLPFLLPAASSDISLFFQDVKAHSGPRAIFCLTAMMFIGAVMTFATFWCMRVTSPTTYSVTGALSKIPLALLGIVIFDHYPTPMGWLGIVVALSGGFLYTYLNLAPAPPPADRSEEGTSKR